MKVLAAPIQPRGLSREDAARYVGISTDKLDQLGRAGVIPRVCIGRRVVYDRAALDRWLDRQSGLATAPAPLEAPHAVHPSTQEWLKKIRG